MVSRDQRHAIVLNGEIYNFLEIRKELESAGVSFFSQSDTEVFLEAFRHWGEDCQKRFNGMWAAAIMDLHENRLWLSRDRFGKKPLFWASGSFGFAFASEMKALLPFLPDIRPNRPLLRNTGRQLLYESTGECLIEGIHRFPAGSCGVVRDGLPTIRRYWNTLDHLPAIPPRYEEQVERLRELFLDSCRLRMRSDVPVGTALSGGLDSSATLAAMAFQGQGNSDRRARSWQNAFTASFPGTFLDETPYASELCRKLGIPLHLTELSGETALKNLPADIWAFEEVYLAAPSPFMALYRSIREAGIVVTLDGHGADELFGGYSFDYLEILHDLGLRYGAAKKILQTWESQWPVGVRERPAPYRHRTAYWLRILWRQWKKNLRRSGDPRPTGWEKLPDRLGHRLYQSIHETILPTLLRNYDRYSMAHGVEIRMPFMDHRIVTFALALPWTSKIRDGFTKAVVRDAVAPFVPASIVRRKDKKGFNPPTYRWLRGPWRESILDLLASQEFKNCELIDPEAAAREVRECLERENFQAGESAWTKLHAFFWEKYFLKPARQATPGPAAPPP
jgi:asparagine synthase (glutamine-hydrolysing)